MKIPSIFVRIHPRKFQEWAQENLQTKEVEVHKEPVVVTGRPSSRIDEPQDAVSAIRGLGVSLKELKPEFEFDVIPVIRKLIKVNPDMGQATADVVKLANTGHKIIFDPGVKPDDQDKMRQYINDVARNWHTGSAGIDGVVNKMFAQLLIAGALATEWVPNKDLDGLEEVTFLYPERIRFIRQGRKKIPYQVLKNNTLGATRTTVKLNPQQFKYFAVNGDTDIPYGFPPFMKALGAVATQSKMRDNIDFIVEAMGLLGHISARIEKPTQIPSESDTQYEARLNSFLEKYKDVLKKGIRDGISVGFIGDHEIDFKETTSNGSGAADLFKQNEQQIASGLEYDPAFMGREGTSDTNITILFTKMLSQLTNLQNIVKNNLEFGYTFALKLAGFKFDYLTVEFNKSTITDDLKYQQSREIRIRNNRVLYADGIISQDQYADDMGFKRPDKKEPRVPIDADAATEGDLKRKRREGKKDESDRRSRDRKNPQGTIRKNGQIILDELLNNIQ